MSDEPKLWPGSKAKKATDSMLKKCKGAAVYAAQSPSGSVEIHWCSGCNLAMVLVDGEVIANGDIMRSPYAFLGDAIFNTGPRGDKVDRSTANGELRELLYDLAENDPASDE